MKSYLEDPRPMQAAGSYDVAVIGGGIAGISAAVAATREGARVILLEKGVVLGGLATAGLINWYEPLCDGAGTQMICGIAEELIHLAVRYGPDTLPQRWQDKRCAWNGESRFASHFSPTILALALNDYLAQSGVEVLLDTMATYPVMEECRCAGVVAEAKEGKLYFESSVVIDASGDAAVLHGAGVPTQLGKNYLSYIAHYVDIIGAAKAAETEDLGKLRTWYLAGSNMVGSGHPEGVPFHAGVTAKEITEFIRVGQALLLQQLKEQPKGSYELVSIPTQPQLRTTRRLEGAYTFTGETWERTFPDAIGCCGDFRARGERYQLPYRVLYHADWPNLLAAGRIISASGEGWEITRVIPVCALTGQAAGSAAAMAASQRCGVGEIDVGELQCRLSRQGVILNWRGD